MMGGGHTLDSLSDGWVPYWLGGAIVAVVVMLYVFFGGMRGVAWVNALQTVLFLCFGVIAFYLISRNLGGYDRIMAEIAADPKDSALLTRARISPQGKRSRKNTPRRSHSRASNSKVQTSSERSAASRG